MTRHLSHYIIPAALILALLGAPASSQEFNVVGIEVQGNTTAATSLILSVAGISEGDQINATKTQEAVRRLYGLGFFRDIRLDAEEVTGGLKLYIIVSELPKLRNLIFKGNKQVKTKDLEERLDLSEGAYLSNNLIFEKKKDIIDLYGEKGYFMAEVEHEVDYTVDSTEVDLTYKISEGSKVKVEKVVLTGNQRVPADKIIGKMRNRKRGFLKTSNFDKDKYPEDKIKIIDYLHQEGYIDAYLKSDSIVTDTATNRMTIYLDIYEGPKYYFGDTYFTGNEVLPDDALQSVLKYRKRETFNTEKFEASLYEIYFLYQEKGHLHARIIDERKTRDSLIDITFDIVEGLPSEVNLVRIIGNTKTRENVIRREMSLRPGQIFHRSLLLRSIRDITQLNYFANVMPDMVDLPTGDVDIIVSVEEKPTAQVSAGAGYSGRDKFVGTFGLGIPNFRGTGQNVAMNIDIGSRRNSYSVSFTEPWAFNTPTLLGVDLYYTNRDWYTDFTEGRRGGALRLGRRLRWPDNYFRAYLRYRLEDARYNEFSDSYTQTHSLVNRTFTIYPARDSLGNIIVVDGQVVLDTSYYSALGIPLPGSLEKFGERWNRASSLELTILRDSRDLPEFATRGSVLSYSVEQTGTWLGGFWEYRKHMLSVSKFVPLFWKIALASKVTYGVVTSSKADSTILEFDRFSVGGTSYSGIVRGYEEGSLTPDSIIVTDTVYSFYVDTLGNMTDSQNVISSIATVRGKYMLVGNFEVQLPIIENQLYCLLFFDVGNSWLNHQDIKFSDLYKGVGLGFRLVVPAIGTIGFDFGYSLDERYYPDGRLDQKQGWRPHFQIGTVFR